MVVQCLFSFFGIVCLYDVFMVCINRNVGFKGFLFKRGSSKFKMWNRRYFIMKDNQLQYQKKGPAKVHVVLCSLVLMVLTVITGDSLGR